MKKLQGVSKNKARNLSGIGNRLVVIVGVSAFIFVSFLALGGRNRINAASCGSCSYRVCCHTSCDCGNGCGNFDGDSCSDCDGDECCDGLGLCTRPGCSAGCDCTGCSITSRCTCGGGGGSCFPAGTKITMADGTEKDIEDVQIGDQVLTYDANSHSQVPGTVTVLESPIREELFILNEGLVRVTNEHPFYVRKDLGNASAEAWASIQPSATREETKLSPLYTLAVGDHLYTEDGEWVELYDIEYVKGTVQTYNLKGVSKTNTFYADGLLVHNKCTCDCDCSNLPTPSAPSLVSPANNATGVRRINTVLDWNDVTYWGQDQKSCTNNNDPCNCTPGESGLPDHRYELYLSTVWASPATLPSQGTPCPTADGRYRCNVTASQYTNTTWLSPGTRYYWAVRAVNPGPGGSPGGNGVSCTVRSTWVVRSFVTNYPPQVVSVSPSSGLSGTYSDLDNYTGSVSACSDQNPQIFTMRYRDQDGCQDINRAYFWIDDTMPNVNQLHSSAHGSIQKSGSTWTQYGLGYDPLRGATCGDGSTGPQCYLNYDWDVYGGDVPQSYGPCTPSYPTAYTDFWDPWMCLWGSPPTEFAVPTNVTCDGANDLLVDWQIRFFTDIGYDLDVMGYVSDTAGDSDGWDDVGDWWLDFDLPDGDIYSEHQSGAPSGSVHFYESASDDDVWDSGLRLVLDRDYRYRRNGTWSSWVDEGAGPDQPINRDPVWNRIFGPVTTFRGGDVIESRISVVDWACNMSSNQDTSDEVAHEWIKTFRGDVYGYSTYYDPIQISGDYLSSYWIGTNTAIASGEFGAGLSTNTNNLFGSFWTSSSYDDLNRRSNRIEDWYTTLWTSAESSDFVKDNQGGSIIDSSNTNILNTSGRGVYRFTGGNATFSGSCRGQKVIFIQSGTVTLQPNIGRYNRTSACVFIGHRGSRIQVSPGSDMAGIGPDYIRAVIVTDGSFVVLPDDVLNINDRLVISGSVFAWNANFQRDLVFENNESAPAERVNYDARHLYLLRDMLGRIDYTDFECGVVQGSNKCVNW